MYFQLFPDVSQVFSLNGRLCKQNGRGGASAFLPLLKKKKEGGVAKSFSHYEGGGVGHKMFWGS